VRCDHLIGATPIERVATITMVVCTRRDRFANREQNADAMCADVANLAIMNRPVRIDRQVKSER
jgi:hypothetical protein